MAMVIKPKRKFTAGAPTTSDIVEGEIAINTADRKLYVRDNSNNIIEIGGGGGSTSDITQSSHGFAVKDAIRHNGSSWVKAQANATTTLALGIVTKVADTNTFTIAQSGRFELSSHGLTVGQWYYLSADAAGGLVTTEPSISQPIVYVESASFIYVYQYRPTNLLINGTSSIIPGDNTVTSAKIVDGTIVADDLADDAVTAAKIADNSVDIARLNVSDGSNGQVLKTDGAGNLSFVTVSIPGAAASFTQVDITAEGDLRLQDASGGQFVALEAPSTIGSSYTLELPAADGSNGQLLKTNGSGTLSFTDPPSSGTSRSETFFMGLL